MSGRRLLAALSVIALVALAGCGGEAPQPRSGREDPPGFTPVRETALTLVQKWVWRAPTGSAGMPVSDGNVVALTSGRQRLSLLDGDGRARWEATRVDLRDVAPAFTPNLVLAATEDGVVAYDRATGRERWGATLGERANTPVVAAGRAVVTTWEGSLAALDLTDGRVTWRSALGGDALGPAATAGDAVVATFDSGRVAGAVAADAAAHGLSLDDGATRWRRPLQGAGSPEVPPLVLPGAEVLAAHRQGGFALLDGRDGRLRWQVTSGGATVRGSPAGPGPNGWFALPLHDGRLLLGGPDREVDIRQPPGLVTGLARGPGDRLLVATGQGRENGLTAVEGW